MSVTLKTVKKHPKLLEFLEKCKERNICSYIEYDNEVTIFYNSFNTIFARCLSIIIRDIEKEDLNLNMPPFLNNYNVTL